MASDLLPLNLLRSCSHSILRRPLLGIQNDSFQKFHSLETIFLAQSIALLHHQLLNPLVIT